MPATPENILKNLCSQAYEPVKNASWEIINRKFDRDFMSYFIQHLPAIHAATDELDMGQGMVLSNKRIVNAAVKTIELHHDGVDCPCTLHKELECFNPDVEEGNGNILVVDRIFTDSRYIDYFIVECKHCQQRWKVTENDYHFRYWNWQMVSDY